MMASRVNARVGSDPVCTPKNRHTPKTAIYPGTREPRVSGPNEQEPPFQPREGMGALRSSVEMSTPWLMCARVNVGVPAW